MTYRVFGEDLTASDVLNLFNAIESYCDNKCMFWVKTSSIQASRNDHGIVISREPINPAAKHVDFVNENRVTIKGDKKFLMFIHGKLSKIVSSFDQNTDMTTLGNNWSCSKTITAMKVFNKGLK